ncbi:TetR/AcrR family transcriptional regulator [Streptomyces sp. NPDC058773]|uniref:TetR/AcrR family transcriptional regulator n=1 Tax=Streptomyces sp. NPDC058773 TaxID=3346632 RepID=UPI0036AD0384
MDLDEARTRILDAAERLFYDRGIQSVGMDELRGAAGVSLKRLYQCFPAKRDLVEAYLRRRDARWRTALAEYVDARAGGPADRPLAVFDWLGDWFAETGFRGCAFVNAYGELGAASEAVGRVAREHKEALRRYVAGLVRALPVAGPEVLAGQVVLLIDGAIAGAALMGEPDAARRARTAAAALIEAAGGGAGAGARSAQSDGT